MKSYTEKLKDPHWQRRRLEIFTAHHWACDTCQNGETDGIALEIHHKYYDLRVVGDRIVRADPWDYPDEAFRVLCLPCHQQTEIALMEIHKALGDLDHFDLAALAEDIMKATDKVPIKMVLHQLLWTLGEQGKTNG